MLKIVIFTLSHNTPCSTSYKRQGGGQKPGVTGQFFIYDTLLHELHTPWGQESEVRVHFFIYDSWGLFKQNKFGEKTLIVREPGGVSLKWDSQFFFESVLGNFNCGPYMYGKHDFFGDQISDNLQSVRDNDWDQIDTGQCELAAKVCVSHTLIHA